jgi:hypothetical protein
MIVRAVRAVLVGSAGLAFVTSVHAGVFTTAPTTDLPAPNYIGALGDPPDTAMLDAVLPAPDTSYTVSGGVDGDPELDVIQKVTNTSGHNWISYKVTLNPTAGSTIDFGSIAVEPVLAPSGYPNIVNFLPNYSIDQVGHTITFAGNDSGDYVPVGQKVTVWISFGVTGDSQGDYGYIVTNAPAISSDVVLPEPASLAMLGCGAMLLFRRRR